MFPGYGSKSRWMILLQPWIIISSVHFSHSVMSDSLQPHGLQQPRLPCPSHLLELAHIHVHWVSDVIQPSCPLSSPSPAFSLSRHLSQVFSNESSLHIMWPKYWSFNFSISPSNEYSGLISLGLTGLISLLSKRVSKVFSSTTAWKCRFFGAQPS